MEQQHVAGPGRPEEPGTWGTHASPHGRDPLGIKDLASIFTQDKSPLQHKYRNDSPLSLETQQKTALIKTLKSKFKTSSIIHESLNENKNDSDKGTLLDETRLIDFE
jgi:hypothetical protein